jgi:RNase adaptor protein for sRNA GlmZ degradation
MGTEERRAHLATQRQEARDSIPDNEKVVAALHEIAELLVKTNERLSAIELNTRGSPFKGSSYER